LVMGGVGGNAVPSCGPAAGEFETCISISKLANPDFKILWSQAAGLPGGYADPEARLDAEVAYGLDVPRALLTPYAGVSLAESGEVWRALEARPRIRGEPRGEPH